MSTKSAEAVLFLVIVLAIIILLPVALIASLNTLFPSLLIAYGFSEWLSAFFIMLVLGGTSIKKKV
jgi:hypothetical protein